MLVGFQQEAGKLRSLEALGLGSFLISETTSPSPQPSINFALAVRTFGLFATLATNERVAGASLTLSFEI